MTKFFEDLLAMIAGHEHGAKLTLTLEPDEGNASTALLMLSAESRKPGGKRVCMSWAMFRDDRGRVASYLEHVSREVGRAFEVENGRPFSDFVRAVEDIGKLSLDGLHGMGPQARKLVQSVLAAREGSVAAVMAATHARAAAMLAEVARLLPSQESSVSLGRIKLPGERTVVALRPDGARGRTLAALWVDPSVTADDLEFVLPALSGKLIR